MRKQASNKRVESDARRWPLRKSMSHSSIRLAVSVLILGNASAPRMRARGNCFDYMRLRAGLNGRPMRSWPAPRGNCPVR